MSSPSLGQRLRYRFDSFMARGGSSIFISLMLFFLVLFVSISLIRLAIYFFMGAGQNQYTDADTMGEQMYIVWLGMTDPGNMNHDLLSHSWFKVPAMLAGMSGVVILSMLIAFITTALDQKLTQLRKGHSKVIESDHTLILGWNGRVTEILRELVIANESEDNPCVVILSEREKEYMDDQLSLLMPDTQNTRVVTRSGAVSSVVNLDIASLSTCKSVVVLAYCDDAASEAVKVASDIRVIKTILAVGAGKEEGAELNIVAELFTERSRTIAEDISSDVTTVDAQEILAKILVQTSRSVGLSVVYGEALSFDGCEMYFHNDDWGGLVFGELQFHFPDGVPLGLRTKKGDLLINPPPDRIMASSDDILILAEDDSTIEFQAEPVARPRDIELAGGRVEMRIERELLIGWNPKLPTILREYADYVLEGSTFDVMIDSPPDDIRSTLERLDAELDKIEIRLVDASPLSSESLTSVEPWTYDNILILSRGIDNPDPETTDSETIVVLLLLRQLFDAELTRNGNETIRTKLITEVMDSNNQELIARAGVNDFIISNRFVSMMLAQVSEEQDIKRVYDDLFSEDGSEIYLKPASLYFTEFPAEVSFADMMGIAQKREEVCIGVKITAKETHMDENFGVKLIPEKNTRYRLEPNDCLIVVAEDET
ncbi:hypothetical protein NG895_22010 [Aeoliella sp. ICT_H6.2]|uniref:CASTOR/POLLUX/SYM8 ion channel conserved domain-containing protein n=1 Tax=Aeoliella straminimaris TaxID=2954799 RepID=A0A9X2FEJ2_9BACT|nr:hypothetical protein [Aeoliella straminimaris]MCO6046582.1 hypothetical protein [Aeoliella straminimaris]